MRSRSLLWVLAVGAGSLVSVPTFGDQDIATGTGGGLTVNAHLNFRIIIPESLRFRVGSTGTTIDTVEFDFTTGTPPAVGSSTPLPQTSAAVDVEIEANFGGTVAIEASGPANLTNTFSSATIPITDITGTAGSSLITPPALDGSADGSATITAGVTLADTWSFSYANTVLAEGGTYETATPVTFTITVP